MTLPLVVRASMDAGAGLSDATTGRAATSGAGALFFCWRITPEGRRGCVHQSVRLQAGKSMGKYSRLLAHPS